MQPNGADRWARAPRVLWRLAPDRVLVRPVGGDGLDLTGMAALVWMAVDEPHRLDDLAQELAGIDPTVTEESLTKVLTQLASCDLVRVVP